MEIELLQRLNGRKLHAWTVFLAQIGLEADPNTDSTVLVWDDGRLIATGSRQDNLLKCIAVDPARQGQGLTATVLTALRQDAFHAGHRHLFLYTKPVNQWLFSSLFFYPLAQTAQVLLMENQPDGIGRFLATLPVPKREGRIGAIVMNCNPFTLGHRYLIETAAVECDWLYVFILSEEKSLFPAADRLALVEAGTRDLQNVSALPTGPYLISNATFPTYFLKDRENVQTVHCQLDIAIFMKYFVPKFGITTRYVGSEPLSPMTAQYNAVLAQELPPRGIALRQIPRLEQEDHAPISASAVRSLLGADQREAVHRLVPQSTLDYLEKHNLL